jgi:hypothetical protein
VCRVQLRASYQPSKDSIASWHRVSPEHHACYDLSMKKMLKKIGSTPKSQVISKSRKPVAKPVPARNAKPDFIGRLKGAFRIVGDIESPVVPAEEWECCREDDLERINQVAEGINAESADVLD